MAKMNINEYTPDFVASPGDTLLEVLEDRDMSATDLAARTDRSVEFIQGLLGGRTVITREIARSLEAALSVSASFWINLERNYRSSLARNSGSGMTDSSKDTKAAAPR
jgi:plasmid maintenance system antidote protein VapI